MDNYVRQQFVAESRANVAELRDGLLRLDFEADIDAAGLVEVLAVFAGNVVEMATICDVRAVAELARAIETSLASTAAVDRDAWRTIGAATELLSRQLDSVETISTPPACRTCIRTLSDLAARESDATSV